MWSKANTNFKIYSSAKKCLIKSPSLTVYTIASIVYTSFKYFTVIWDPVPVVDKMFYLMSLKASIVMIFFAGAGNCNFCNSISLLKRRGSTFLCVILFLLSNCSKRFLVQAHRSKVMPLFKNLFRWSWCNNLWINKPVFVPHALMVLV